MYTISLIMGDWSHDGHNQTDTVVVHSNLDARGIQHAYDAGIEKLRKVAATVDGAYDGDINQDLRNLCYDYEDSVFPAKLRNFLVACDILQVDEESEAFGSNYSVDWEYDPNADGTLDSDSFADLYIAIARSGDALLTIERVPHTQNMYINIGGYGLFYG